MDSKKAKWIQTARWIYWTLTGAFALLMAFAAFGYLTRSQQAVEGIIHLAYPMYMLKILGVAKLLGVLALLQTRFRTLKEWAYAGFTINLIGAAASHFFEGDPWSRILFPLVFLALLMLTYRQWKTGWM